MAGSAGNRHRRAALSAYVAALLGLVFGAVVADKVLRRVWPDQHDLSDISTGFLILVLSALVGVVVACLAAALVLFCLRRQTRHQEPNQPR